PQAVAESDEVPLLLRQHLGEFLDQLTLLDDYLRRALPVAGEGLVAALFPDGPQELYLLVDPDLPPGHFLHGLADAGACKAFKGAAPARAELDPRRDQGIHPVFLGLAPSGSFALLVAITTTPRSWERPPRLRGRAADAVTPLALALPSPPPLPAPLERCRGFVPMPGDGLEPGDDRAGVSGVLAVQRPPL